MFVSYYFFFPTICDLIIEFPLCLIFKVHKIGCISLQQMFFFFKLRTRFSSTQSSYYYIQNTLFTSTINTHGTGIISIYTCEICWGECSSYEFARIDKMLVPNINFKYPWDDKISWSGAATESQIQ